MVIAKTCHGCRHFRPGDSECSKLQGVRWCQPCQRDFVPGQQVALQQSVGCPKCAEYLKSIDAAMCPDGRRSPCCPGYEAKAAPLPSQLNLFDFGD